MDPKATLDAIKDAIAEEDFAHARYLLREYRAWRKRGGFEPPRGDARMRELARELTIASSLGFSDYTESRKKNPLQKPGGARQFFISSTGGMAGFEYGWDGRTPITLKVSYGAAPPKREYYSARLSDRMVNTPGFQDWYKTSDREVYGTQAQIIAQLEAISAGAKSNPRIRDTSNTVRSGTVAYKGYLIQPMMAGGFVITQGKHHISFASSVAAAKKIIDTSGISARNPRKRSAGKTVARNPAQKVFAISSRVDTLKPWKVYAVAPTFEAAKQIAKSLQDRGYYSQVTN